MQVKNEDDIYTVKNFGVKHIDQNHNMLRMFPSEHI